MVCEWFDLDFQQWFCGSGTGRPKEWLVDDPDGLLSAEHNQPAVVL